MDESCEKCVCYHCKICSGAPCNECISYQEYCAIPGLLEACKEAHKLFSVCLCDGMHPRYEEKKKALGMLEKAIARAEGRVVQRRTCHKKLLLSPALDRPMY